MHDSKRIIKNAQLVLHTNRAMKPDNKCRNPVHLHCSRKPVERQIMFDIVMEMAKELELMDRDTYMRTKLILNAVTPQGRVRHFLNALFALVESKQPLLIDMK